MTETATVDASADAQTSGERLLLGKKGWAAYVLVALINLYGGLPAMSGTTQIVGYTLLCLIGAYVIVLFWKAVLQAVGVLN